MKKESEYKKRVAIYTRVSSEEQKKEGISLDAQKKSLEDYAIQKEWFVHKIYTDAGITAKDIKGRKAFQECLNDAKLGKFSAILITKFDRPFRNTIEALMTLDQLHAIKVDFISLAENIDTTTPMGRAMFSIISVFAELERNMTAQRVSDVNKFKFNKGIMIGKAPLGYKWSKRQKSFVVDLEDSAKVKDIFEMSASGINFKEICSKHKIAKSSYYSIIKNDFYTGMIEFNGEKRLGSHDPLISKQLFEKVNKLKNRGATNGQF